MYSKHYVRQLNASTPRYPCVSAHSLCPKYIQVDSESFLYDTVQSAILAQALLLARKRICLGISSSLPPSLGEVCAIEYRYFHLFQNFV